MSIRIHEPIAEKYMVSTKHIGEHGICQTLRNAYALCDNPKAHKDHIKIQLRIAMSMAKSMNAKLIRQHKELKKIIL
jgi:hypothetical protein